MTLLELIQSNQNIIYRGYKDGIFSFSFDDKEKVYNFSEEEVAIVSEYFRTPEEQKHYDKMIKKSNIVKEEFERRKKHYYIAFILMALCAIVALCGGIYTYVTNNDTTVLVLLSFSCVASALTSWSNFNDYKKIKEYE